MKWNEVTWYSRLGALILFVGILPALSFYVGLKYANVLHLNERTEQITTERQSLKVSESVLDVVDGELESGLSITMEFQNNWTRHPSPTGAYTFVVVRPGENNICSYLLLDSNELAVRTPFINTDTVLCSYSGPGGPFDGFEGWIDENSFIFSPQPESNRIIAPSIMHVVNLAEHTEVINEPPQGYLYTTYIQEHGYWLYRTGPEGAFVILDSDQNILKKVEGRFKVALYDTPNDGLVFLGKKETESGQSLVVVFVDLNTFEAQVILETDPVEVQGKGCEGWGSTDSIAGEVRLKPGSCYFENVKDYINEEDELIHIKL